jgi:hypothetical protein
LRGSALSRRQHALTVSYEKTISRGAARLAKIKSCLNADPRRFEVEDLDRIARRRC